MKVETEQQKSILSDWNVWGQATSEDLEAKNNQILAMQSEKEDSAKQLAELQDALDEIKLEMEHNEKKKIDEIDELQQEIAICKKLIEDFKAEIQSKEAEIENLKSKPDDIESKEDIIIESEDIEQLKSQIENQNSDLSNWKTWSEEKTLELEAKNNEIQIIQKEKQELEKQSEILQENLDNLKQELEQVTETKNKEILSFQEEINLLKDSKDDLDEQNLEEIPPKETSTSKEEDIEKLMSEIEQQKSVLNDWNVWGQAKTEEYNQLLEGKSNTCL